MQILLTPDGLPGATPDGIAPLAVEKELLDDFLSRLQAIVRGPSAEAPESLDDTRPTRRGARS